MTKSCDEMIHNSRLAVSPIQNGKKKSSLQPVYSFTWFDIVVVLISMGTYIADIITDILVILVYWKLDEKTWAALTLTFLIVPSIIMQIFSTRWYMADGHRISWSMFGIHLVMMGPVKRYITVLKFGFRARKTKRIEDYQAMYSELSDVSMLRLFESFLESAPQLVLQLYIMIKVVDEDYILTGIAACFSLLSLSWAIAAYTKALRTAIFSQDSRKKRVSLSGLAFQTLWRVGMVAGRITALVLFATVYPVWLLGGVAIHWLVMTAWLIGQDTDFCGTWWEENLFNSVIGVIHVFCFFNMKEGKTRWRMIIFYIIMFAENSAMILLWWPQRTAEMWYNIPALFTVWGGFCIGLVSMVMYYRYFHPSSLKKCHCCMFYYHLVYRCCPCDGNTTLNPVRYERNVKARESFTESSSSDCDKYRPFSFICDQDAEGALEDTKMLGGGESRIKKSSFIHRNLAKHNKSSQICKEYEKNVKLTRMKSLGSPKKEKKLIMPKPKATSTPGDDLEDKYRKGNWARKGSDIEEEKRTSSSGSEDDISLLRQNRDDVFRMESVNCTPSVLKNLPGAKYGPVMNKGNSTLVREWVKKAQAMAVGERSKHSVVFEVTPDNCFEINESAMKHMEEDEKEFMTKHFGESILPAKTTQPSGKRDIMRMKSFNKKERQGRGRKKRRRSSYGITDIRNSFREAFGFHTIDVDEVLPGEDMKIEMKTRKKKRIPKQRKPRQNDCDSDWPETDVDIQDDVRYLGKDIGGGKVVTENVDLERKDDSKLVNMILARIDKPPDEVEVTEVKNLRTSVVEKRPQVCLKKTSKTNLRVEIKLKDEDFQKQESCLNNLHTKNMKERKATEEPELKNLLEYIGTKLSTEFPKEKSKLVWKKVPLYPPTIHSERQTDVESSSEMFQTCESKILLPEKSEYDNLTPETTVKIKSEDHPVQVHMQTKKISEDNYVVEEGDEGKIITDGDVNPETEMNMDKPYPEKIREKNRNHLQPNVVNEARKNDAFGPIIRMKGDKITITHKNQLPKENNTVYVGPPRRDRIEYLYKLGRLGLMKAAEDSPARKRLTFNREKIQWSEEEEDLLEDEDAVEGFHIENEKKNTGKKSTRPNNGDSENQCAQRKQRKSERKKMEKSVEALGKSMEGLLYGGDNYTVHIRENTAKDHVNPRVQKRENKSLKVFKQTLAKENTGKQVGSSRPRRTLGSIENHSNAF